MKWLLVLLFVACACAGRRVLLVFPAPGRSHSLLGDSIARILSDAGYEVTYVTPYPKEDAARIVHVNISSIVSELSGGEKLNMIELARNPRPAHRLLNIGPSVTRRALLHPAVQQLLGNPTLTFDVVIGGWFVSELVAPLASLYDCPLIWYSAMDAHWMTLRLVNEPVNPAYSVDIQSRSASTIPYTMWERAYQLWMQLYLTAWSYYVTKFVEIPAYEEIYKSAMHLRGRTLPAYEPLTYNASLLLLNSYPPLAQPLPLPQSAKQVGGHHIDLPIKPLPQDLQDLLDNAKKGVIYFSMGSNLKSKDFPEYMKKELVDIFGQLEQTVLWKFEEKLENVPSNLHVLDWAPQHSILNHKNTLMFISHGGLLSVTEATYFGVPIIGIPLFGDQFVNVDLVEQRGAGIRVDFTNDLPLKIDRAINEVIGNYSYRINARQASSIFKRRPASPQRELAHWVDLVVDTRGALHLRSPALLVPLAEKLHLDILFFVAMVLWFLSKVVKVIKVYLTTSDYDADKKDK